jgi:hypothetical protein
MIAISSGLSAFFKEELLAFSVLSSPNIPGHAHRQLATKTQPFLFTTWRLSAHSDPNIVI